MFCINCGKQIADNARFCNYCGARVVNCDESGLQNAQNISGNLVPPPTGSVINTENVENVENSVNLLNITSEIPSFVPQMNESPKSGYSPDSVPTAGAPASGSAASPANSATAVNTAPTAPATPAPERKYTLGHLIMCLASTAVMAIAAGIFAGLYFSVV